MVFAAIDIDSFVFKRKEEASRNSKDPREPEKRALEPVIRKEILILVFEELTYR